MVSLHNCDMWAISYPVVMCHVWWLVGGRMYVRWEGREQAPKGIKDPFVSGESAAGFDNGGENILAVYQQKMLQNGFC